MSGHYKIAWLCEALLVSRSGYYAWIKRRRFPGPRQLENMRLRERIREEFVRSRQTYGSPRLAQVLGCPGRRNRIARLMRLERIFARQRSKYRPFTTDSRHGGPIAPNRLRALVVRRPNQVWVTDVTCVLTAQGWLYLVAVLDISSRRVIGWAMSQLLDTALTSAALRMAINQRHHSQNLIVHSDRGAQFASAAYRQLLSQHGLTAFMSRKGKPKLPLTNCPYNQGNPRETLVKNLNQAGWSCGCIVSMDSQRRDILVVVAQRDGKRFIVRTDERLAAFVELESAIRNFGKRD
jgi:putative transposase